MAHVSDCSLKRKRGAAGAAAQKNVHVYDRFMPRAAPLMPFHLLSPPLSPKKVIGSAAAHKPDGAASESQLPSLGSLLHTMAETEHHHQRRSEQAVVSFLSPLGPPPLPAAPSLTDAFQFLDLAAGWQHLPDDTRGPANTSDSDEEFDPPAAALPGVAATAATAGAPAAGSVADIQAKMGHHRHGHKIARALGFADPGRVLQYQSRAKMAYHVRQQQHPSSTDSDGAASSGIFSPLGLASASTNATSASSSSSTSYYFSYGQRHGVSPQDNSTGSFGGPVAQLLRSPIFQHPSTGDKFSSLWGVYDDGYFGDYERDLTAAYKNDDYYYFYDGDDVINGTGARVLLPPTLSHGTASARRTRGGAGSGTSGTDQIYSHIPYRILDAPGLRNDFYSNLVSWSKVTGQLAVGLVDQVYVWSEGTGAVLLKTPHNYGDVTSVVFAPPQLAKSEGCRRPPENVLALGYKDGSLVVYDVDNDSILAIYALAGGPVSFLCWAPPADPLQVRHHDDTLSFSVSGTPSVSAPGSLSTGGPVSISNSSQQPSGNSDAIPTAPAAMRMDETTSARSRVLLDKQPYSQHLMVGDDCGSVVRLHLAWRKMNENDNELWSESASVDDTFDEIEVFEGEVLKGHSQQICAISFSVDQEQLAIGGNDNLVTVWNVSDWSRPTLAHKLVHKAAVKALEYCPWAPNLLATGAGSQDRNIRFWHTRTGTLLKTIETKGQVTSVLWSRHKRQLMATFGFHDNENPILLAVYAFPQYALGSGPAEYGIPESVANGPLTGTTASETGTAASGGTESTTSSTGTRPRNELGRIARIPRLGQLRGRTHIGAAPTAGGARTRRHYQARGRTGHRPPQPPASRPILQVPTPSGLRVLSATASPDGTCVCVATNDETVRFIKLWSDEGPRVPMALWQSVYHPNSCVLESDLIGFKEGIEKVDEIIR